MTPRAFWRRLLATSLVVAALPAASTNLGFMKDAPIAKFNDQDMKLFTQTLNGTLEQGADGEARRWSNPETKAEGEVKVVQSFERAAMRCRKVTIRNAAKGQTASSQASFCRQASGQWALVQ